MKLSFVVFSLILSLSFVPDRAHATEFPEKASLVTINGETVDFAKLKGAPIVMVFGAYWCHECKRVSQEIQRAYVAYRGKGVQFVGVYAKSSKQQVRELVANHDITYPVCLDNGMAEQFRVRAIPMIFIFSRDGKCTKKFIGYTRYKALAASIEKLVAKEVAE